MSWPGRVALSLVAALLLGAASCGGDGDDSGGDGATISDREQTYADAWAGALTDVDAGGLGVTPEEARCLGEALMDTVGLTPFEEADIEPGDIGGGSEVGGAFGVVEDGLITAEQADAIVEEWGGCADLSANYAELMGQLSGADEEAQACIDAGLEGTDLVEETFRSVLQGRDAIAVGEPDPILTMVGACVGDGPTTGGRFVEDLTSLLVSGGQLDEEQARCVAQGTIDLIGFQRLVEMVNEDEAGDGEDELEAAMTTAAEGCGVPPSALGG